MEYRMIGTENLTRALFAHFIRRQEVTKCWRREAGEWVIRDAPFTDDWSEKDYALLLAELRELLSNGGIVIGAFYKNELKGFASVSGVLFGGRREYLDLTNLHVSQDMRRQGIGRELFLRAADIAREHGAKKLYLSAHSAIESQAFYRAMGCVEATEYSAYHTEKEPFDCQMEYCLDKEGNW